MYHYNDVICYAGSLRDWKSITNGMNRRQFSGGIGCSDYLNRYCKSRRCIKI